MTKKQDPKETLTFQEKLSLAVWDTERIMKERPDPFHERLLVLLRAAQEKQEHPLVV